VLSPVIIANTLLSQRMGSVGALSVPSQVLCEGMVNGWNNNLPITWPPPSAEQTICVHLRAVIRQT
jgi:hypothetical protein